MQLLNGNQLLDSEQPIDAETNYQVARAARNWLQR